MRLGWLIQSGGFDLASNRYRCLHIAFGLGQRGHENVILQTVAEADVVGLDVLIIIKRLDVATLNAAALARKHRVPVVFDLCDDVVSRGYRADGTELNRIYFAAVGSVLDSVTTTGAELAERLRPFLPPHTRIVVIPDLSETPELIAASRSAWEACEPKDVSPEASRRLSGQRAIQPLRILQRTAYFVTHPVWALRRARDRLHRAVSRPLYAVTHPAWAFRRATKQIRAASVWKGLRRIIYVLRHPDWLFRRVRRAIVSVPLVRPAVFVVAHPRAALRAILRALRVRTLPVWTALGRAAYVSRHPDWLFRRVRRAIVSVPLVRPAVFVVAHPRAALRAILRALRVRTLPVRNVLGRAAYVSRHPDWLFRRVRRAILSFPYVGAMLFAARHPRATLRKWRESSRSLRASEKVSHPAYITVALARTTTSKRLGHTDENTGARVECG